MSLDRLRKFDKRIRRRDRIARIPLRRLRDRENPLESYSEVQFKQRFHMYKETVVFITNLIQHDLHAPLRRGIQLAPIIQVLIAIRFYCTGMFQLSNCDLNNVSQPTISNVVKRVSGAICKLRNRFINFPTEHSAKKIREGFYRICKFPGKYINVKSTTIF